MKTVDLIGTVTRILKRSVQLISRIMAIFICIVILASFVVGLYLQHEKFGAKPEGNRLEMIQASPNYKNGAFVNISYTPRLTQGYSMGSVMYNFIFRQGVHTKPAGSIPTVHTDLKRLGAGDWLVWFGHSSYFIQTDNIKVLVDPVFSGSASPILGTTKSFKGSDVYNVEDLPEIDYLFISHDHYDHLDYQTIKQLRGQVKKVVCGLGVGAHFERWGYAPERIIEMDWNTEVQLQEGFRVYGLTARHYSGRNFRTDQTLWMSFLLQTPRQKIYIGGDSGYDQHFKEIGNLHGPIDLAILENGQYNEAWKAVHFMPGENLQAAIDLKARRLMPVHSSKFALALHDWNEPMREIVQRNLKIGLPLVTPKIGELVDLNDNIHVFNEWWNNIGQHTE
jgi:L-ascorbate metabolism protein UlaG (beta-lactamase superfamily)